MSLPWRNPRRSGVTLLEVLMAILVLSVGLLSLAALIPIGNYEMNEGAKLDRSSTMGRAAYRDLLVRGYLKPENWLNPVEQPVARAVLQGRDRVSEPFTMITTPGTLSPPLAPVVLDPLLVFGSGSGRPASFDQDGDLSSAHLVRASTFPYLMHGTIRAGAPPNSPESSSNVPVIPRVTLRRFPRLPLFMHYDLADRTFRSQDDLVFETPKDPLMRPRQVYHQDTRMATQINAPVTDSDPVVYTRYYPTYRLFRGDFSWFVTISPSLYEMRGLDELSRMTNVDPSSDAFTSDKSVWSSVARQYSVAVVVMYKRDVSRLDSSGITLADRDRAERMCWVDFMGGADARLRVGGINDRDVANRALMVKANEWIAVIGGFNNPLLLGQKQYTLMWHRVLGVSPDVVRAGDGIWYRDVTLMGASFVDPNFSFDDEDGFSYPNRSGFQPPTGFGVILDGAVGVYQKTMTLEGDSLWSQGP